GDMGVGECAGEVVSRVDLDLAAAERQVFEASVLLDQADWQRAGAMAYTAMVQAAWALVKTDLPDFPLKADQVVPEFKKRFYDTQIFWDPFAGGKFGHYLLRAHEKAGMSYGQEEARQRVEEAQLVVEAAYTCRAKIGAVTVLPAAARGAVRVG
ncbi:MAG: nitrite/sulfite reductase, partial [Anaerolineales bacterium]